MTSFDRVPRAGHHGEPVRMGAKACLRKPVDDEALLSAIGAGITLYLAYLGFTGGASGGLLWPAVVLHLVPTLLLARTGRSGKTSTEGKSSW